MKKTLFCIWLCLGLLLSAMPVPACTGISFNTKDGCQMQARTIEWGGYNLNSKLIILPRGQKNISLTKGGKKGLAWTNK